MAYLNTTIGNITVFGLSDVSSTLRKFRDQLNCLEEFVYTINETQMFDSILPEGQQNLICFKMSITRNRNFDIIWNENVRPIVLSNAIISSIFNENMKLHIFEHGIWPSSEDRYLFDALCKYSLDTNVFNFRQCLYFDENDKNALSSFLQCCIQFGWGAVLISNIDNWMYFNHDGYGYMKSQTDALERFSEIVNLKITAACD